MNTARTGLSGIFVIVVAFVCSSTHAEQKGLSVSVGAMTMMNSFSQGGQGPEGFTLLTHSEINYHFAWSALGFFHQYDRQGANEIDTGYGPKMELHTGPFYIETGYAMRVKRAYTDRSIAAQTGTGWLLGFGARFPLGGNGRMKAVTSGGTFLQFSYKYRIHSITQQDGVNLSEPITQKDGYPIFGMGYEF